MDNIPSEGQKSFWSNWKVIIGSLLIVAAVVVLIKTSMSSTAQYFLTINELMDKKSEIVGKTVRISGAVQDGSIEYDGQNFDLSFVVAHIPVDEDDINRLGGMAQVLHDASIDPKLASVRVVYHGVKPDLLKKEAQAIVTGSLDEAGVFNAEEILLKCPTRYEEAYPQQAQ